jgi:hypothetical protein
MAASTFVPAPRSAAVSSAPRARALASAAAARTAPRGEGLATVTPLPSRGGAAIEQVHEDPSIHVLGRAAAAVPAALRVVPAPRTGGAVRIGMIAATVVAVAAALILGVSGVVGSASAGELDVAGHVVLQPGETLWDVAVRSAPAGVDPRRQLDDIRRVNGFGPGAHEAWTVVLLPAR